MSRRISGISGSRLRQGGVRRVDTGRDCHIQSVEQIFRLRATPGRITEPGLMLGLATLDRGPIPGSRFDPGIRVTTEVR